MNLFDLLVGKHIDLLSFQLFRVISNKCPLGRMFKNPEFMSIFVGVHCMFITPHKHKNVEHELHFSVKYPKTYSLYINTMF